MIFQNIIKTHYSRGKSAEVCNSLKICDVLTTWIRNITIYVIIICAFSFKYFSFVSWGKMEGELFSMIKYFQ